MSQLDLAVNAAVSEYKMARMRNMLLMQGSALNSHAGLDSKRQQMWCEFGYKTDLSFSDFFTMYSRGGLANGAVNKLADTCWYTYPWLTEGDKGDKDKEETPWEASLKSVFGDGRVWHQFHEADRRRLVGRYAGLLLRIRDSKPWRSPVRKGAQLVEIIPAWAGSLSVKEFNTDPNSENYGQPVMWSYKQPSINGQPAQDTDVHPDRLFILGSWRAGTIGFLEPGFNNLVNAEKSEGGSSESLLKNAARQLNVNFSEQVDLRNLAATYNVDINQLQERFNDAARDINNGEDVLLITQGAQINPLVSTTPDPRPVYDINLQSFASSVDMPSKVIVGMQTGERASSEDQRYMNKRCQGRRNGDLRYDITDFVRKLMELRIVETKDEFTVMWDDLNEATQAEKLTNAKTMSEINAQSVGNGLGREIFSPAQILGAAGFEDEVGGEFSLPEIDDDNPDPDADPVPPTPGDKDA